MPHDDSAGMALSTKETLRPQAEAPAGTMSTALKRQLQLERAAQAGLTGVGQRLKRPILQVLRVLLLSLSALIMLYPLIWMISNSFKTAASIFHAPLSLVPEIWNFSAFEGALQMAPFDLYIWNSILTATLIVAGQLFLSALLAYALVFYQFPGKNLLFTAVLITYMLPSAATYVPSYVILARMNMLDTLSGLVISNLASVFSIFLLVQTFKGVPKEMLEAARMDGAGDWTILFRVLFPYTRSTILTAALISFVGMYNNYMWPSLITSSKRNMLISVGLNTFFTSQGNFRENLPRLMAANSMAVIPLLLLFIALQKWFIKGISDSGVKG